MLCAQAKELSEIKNSPRISYYKSYKLTSLDCLLFTVYQNWQKTNMPITAQGVMKSVAAMGKELH